jgi:tRNA nucleotidyltransferase (CCA-adding enzyme)
MVKQGEVNALVPDRVWAETQRALSERDPHCFFEVLNQCSALLKLFPEFILPLKQLKISNNTHPEIRFATMTLILKHEDIIALCNRYPIPVIFRELSLVSHAVQSFFDQEKLLPENTLELLEKIDAFRREERFNQLLIIFENSPLIAYLKKAFTAAKAVSAALFIKQGHSGKVLGELIRKKRMEIIRQLD